MESRPTSPPLPTLSQLLQRHASFASPPAPAGASLPPPPPISLRSDAHKRSRSEEDDEEELDESSLGSGGRADEEEARVKEASPTRRPAKSRKPTYLVRKEEKEELLQEIRALQDQVVFLRQRFGVDEQALQDRQLIEKEVANNELRKSVRGQHFQVLAAQSAICELTTKLHSECPIDTFIHLGQQWTQRKETLSALKEPQLRQAAELLERRMQFFSEPREYVESSQFLSDAGDYCSIRFDMTPLEGMHSVKDAFDLVQHYLARMQTRATPQSGAKFSSMDQMASDGNIIQRRMVLSQTDSLATEANFVVFSDLRRSDRSSRKKGGLTSSTAGDLGLLVLNFVDLDDLYPYDPTNYVQHDLSGVIAVESVKRRVKTPHGHEKDENVIVLTRWVLQKLRRSKHHVPSNVMQIMRERINEPSNAILTALKEARPPLDLENRAVYLW